MAKKATAAKPKTRKKGGGGMTVAEAGRKGGLAVRDTRGHEFYEEIGRKGGQKVRDLIAAGKRAMARGR
jgi:general stress protein YciG